MKGTILTTIYFFSILWVAGQDLSIRMKDLDHVYTGIWWYASYPNQYGGDGSKSSEQAGKILIGSTVDQLVDLIRKVKADTIVPGLQEQFFKESENPLKTKQ
jgi:creatinine amidohydrolase